MAPGRPDPDEEWAQWVEWLGEGASAASIADDVTAMIAAREIWDSFRLVYNNKPDRVDRFRTMMSWVSETYVQRQAMAIRRQADTHNDVVSLARLIGQVHRYPDVLSRDRYAAQTAGWQNREEADRFFDEFVGAGRVHIDKYAARADLAKLRSSTSQIVAFADNEVAHYNRAKGTFSIGLIFRDLHRAIDLIVDLFVRYREMILGVSISRSAGVYPDWVTIFRDPWIPDDAHLQRVLGLIRQVQGKRERGEVLGDDE